jgi:hypothetical protein
MGTEKVPNLRERELVMLAASNEKMALADFRIRALMDEKTTVRSEMSCANH